MVPSTNGCWGNGYKTSAKEVKTVEIVILGAGPGGQAAASEALCHGHSVTLVDPDGLGGNALNHSLVPSKVLIRAASTIKRAKQGDARWDPTAWATIMGDQDRRVRSGIVRAKKALQAARVISERANLVAPRTVETDRTKIRINGDVLVIATGSGQRVIPGFIPDGERVWAPRIFRTLKTLPRTLAIVGAGATGLEAASLFSNFGVKVHLYTSDHDVLPDYHHSIRRLLIESIQKQGVFLHVQRRVVRLEAIEHDTVRLHWSFGEDWGVEDYPHVLLATGRTPTWPRDTLESMGFILDDAGFFKVGPTGRTSVDGVYAVGDAAGRPLFASKAWKEGRLAMRDALGLTTEGGGPMVEAIYTDPEVARVGSRTRFPYLAEDKSPWFYASLLDDIPPSLIVYTDAGGRIKGAEAIGSNAAELMSTVAAALLGNLSIKDLSHLNVASPSTTELLCMLTPLGEERC